jgi:hypothetical protein
VLLLNVKLLDGGAITEDEIAIGFLGEEVGANGTKDEGNRGT